MASPFDIFDHSFTIRVVTQETPTRNADGEEVFPTTTSTAITGHISTYTRGSPESEWARQSVGVLEDGDLRFFTESTLVKKGVTIEIERTATLGQEVTRYRVLGLVRDHNLIAKFGGGTKRREFALREVPDTGPTIS